MWARQSRRSPTAFLWRACRCRGWSSHSSGPARPTAAGLRRRQTAVGPLIGLLERGSRRERVIGCRALGWIGSRTAVPIITRALGDRDWKIRMSAAKALGALRAQSAKDDLKYLQIDRNARVRKAAAQALYRLRPR